MGDHVAGTHSGFRRRGPVDRGNDLDGIAFLGDLQADSPKLATRLVAHRVVASVVQIRAVGVQRAQHPVYCRDDELVFRRIGRFGEGFAHAIGGRGQQFGVIDFVDVKRSNLIENLCEELKPGSGFHVGRTRLFGKRFRRDSRFRTRRTLHDAAADGERANQQEKCNPNQGHTTIYQDVIPRLRCRGL